MTNKYDLIIIGASAAGVSAAVYAARRQLNFIVLTTDVGGEVLTSGEIENYPGFPKTDGVYLAEQFKLQLAHNNVNIQENTKIEKIERLDQGFKVSGKTLQGPADWTADSVILASGAHPRTLDIPGEAEFRGRGVTYCTTCDGPLFKNKTVVTVGGGNSALESALMLAELASHVTIVNKNPQFKGEQVLIDRISTNPKINVIYNAKTVEIVGENIVTGLKYRDTASEQDKIIETQGIFIHAGSIPNSTMVDFVQKTPRDAVITDRLGRTDIPGFFAAGDVTDIAYKQIVIAAGHGAIAALSAISYLNTLKR